MRAIALAEHVRTVRPSARQTREAKQDPSLEGVLVFTGISFALAALSVLFNGLNLPSALLF